MTYFDPKMTYFDPNNHNPLLATYLASQQSPSHAYKSHYHAKPESQLEYHSELNLNKRLELERKL